VEVRTLAVTVEKLGAGEILLTCMDKDGTNSGYDLELTKMVKEAVTIPVIASSGAGKVEHFSEVLRLRTPMRHWRRESSTVRRCRSRR